MDEKLGVYTKITAGGVTKTIKEWSKCNSIPKSTIISRLTRGCTPEEAVNGSYQRKERRARPQKGAPMLVQPEPHTPPEATLAAIRALVDLPLDSNGDRIAAISLLLERSGH